MKKYEFINLLKNINNKFVETMVDIISNLEDGEIDQFNEGEAIEFIYLMYHQYVYEYQKNNYKNLLDIDKREQLKKKFKVIK